MGGGGVGRGWCSFFHGCFLITSVATVKPIDSCRYCKSAVVSSFTRYRPWYLKNVASVLKRIATQVRKKSYLHFLFLYSLDLRSALPTLERIVKGFRKLGAADKTRDVLYFQVTIKPRVASDDLGVIN